MHKYRQQLLFYKLLVEQSHSYKGYHVEQGSLVFVEPDESGKVNELSLDYTSEDLERTKQLIQAVWQRIKTLDFPDTSQFSADLKGIIAFEDWLIDNAQ
jgi:DNA helicase-2/ATP-dependent DNA helicase PcrA